MKHIKCVGSKTLAIVSLSLLAACAGADGADGSNGADGVDGVDGTNGSNGNDGAAVFALQTYTPEAIVSQAELEAALDAARGEDNGGLDFDMWATVVDREGVVVAVAYSGADEGSQWPGSRVISAQKANTANSFSLDGFALSTANLFYATQPGQTLFGLQESNPVNTLVAYGGEAEDYGTTSDFMVGKKIGGVNVFGGGLALYGTDGTIIGAVGVSGDLSCADHNIGWKVRDGLGLDNVPAGVASTGDDNIVYDLTAGVSAGGFGHEACNANTTTIGEALPTSHPIGD